MKNLYEELFTYQLITKLVLHKLKKGGRQKSQIKNRLTHWHEIDSVLESLEVSGVVEKNKGIYQMKEQ